MIPCWNLKVIQKNWRAYCDRKTYLRLINESHFKCEAERVLLMDAQQAQLNDELENDRLLLELDNLEFLYKNIEHQRKYSAIIIQRAWRRYKRALLQ